MHFFLCNLQYHFFLSVCLRFVSYMSCTSLDCYMDGQLGFSGDNSVVPCVIEQFLELGSSDSLAVESKTNQKAPIRVWINLCYILFK